MKRQILRVVDKILGSILLIFLIIFDKTKNFFNRNHSSENSSIKNILIIKIIGIGDTALMITPLKILSEKYPNSKITALVTSLSSGILTDQPFLSDVIIYDIFGKDRGIFGFIKLLLTLRKRHFNCIVDFEHHIKLVTILSYLTSARKRIGFYYNKNSLRSFLYTDRIFLNPYQHIVQSYLDLLKPLNVNIENLKNLERIDYSEQDENHVNEWLKKRNIGTNNRIIGIHTGSGPRAPSRRWEKEKFIEIIKHINDKFGANIILTGNHDEKETVDSIIKQTGNRTVYSCAGEFNLKQLAAVIDKCSLFISNDTGPMHISAAMGTKTIGLFGPEIPVRYAPFGENNISIYKKTDCSPCIKIYMGKVHDCKNPICMKSITVDDVWNAIELQLGE